MKDDVEVSVKFTDRTIMAIDNVKEKYAHVTSRRSFMRYAVSENVTYVLKKVEGQKSIRKLATMLTDEVNWLNIDLNSSDLDAKLMPDKSLVDSPYPISISEETDKILKQASKCSNLNRSEVVRLCIIKRLYDVVEGGEHADVDKPLSDAEKRRIVSRWLELASKLDTITDSIIHTLSSEITGKHVQMHYKEPSEFNSCQMIRSVYKDFEGSPGYYKLKEDSLGQEAIEVFEDIVEYNQKATEAMEEALE